VVVNTNHPLIADKLIKAKKKQGDLAKHLYNIALLNQGMLRGTELSEFINKSIEYLTK